MKVLISRTSHWDGEEAPVAGARQEMVSWIDRRTVSTLEEARKQWWGNEFFAEGTDHRVENGMVRRTMPPRNEWVIDIEDVFAFASVHGRLVVTPVCNYVGIVWGIEIYDDYRE